MLSNLFLTVATTTTQTGALSQEVLDAINAGFTQLSGTVTQVIGIAVPAAVSIIALTGGVKYALKKVRGVIASAA